MPEQSPAQSDKQPARAPVIVVCGSGAEETRLNALAEAVGGMLACRGARAAAGPGFIER